MTIIDFWKYALGSLNPVIAAISALFGVVVFIILWTEDIRSERLRRKVQRMNRNRKGW